MKKAIVFTLFFLTILIGSYSFSTDNTNKYYITYMDGPVTGSVEILTKEPISNFSDLHNIQNWIVQDTTSGYHAKNPKILNIIPIPIR